MFNRRLLATLGVATAVSLGLAIWLNRPAAVQQASEKELFASAIKSQREAVDQVVLKSKENNLSLALKDNHWRVEERDGYPANANKVRELLTALGDAKISESKTADPARYNKLGVEDSTDKTVTLTVKAGDQTVSDFIVGTSVFRPAGNYVRRVGEKQSYLIDRELKIGREVRDWIDSDLINLPASKITRVERLLVPPAIQCVRAPCEAPAFYLIKKEGSTEFVMDHLPANIEMQAAHIVSGLTDVMNGLTANDVVKADKFDRSAAKQTVTRFFSDDKKVVTLTYSAVKEKHYAEFEVTAADDASAEVKAEVEKLANKLRGWVFELNSYKGEGLARGFEELTQKKTTTK